jgi:hypothetical protein
MRSTHPQIEGPTDSPERTTATSYQDVDRDGRADYVENDRRTDYVDRDRRTDYVDNRSAEIPTRKVRETKPAFLTTEFWFAAGGIAALIVIYLVEDDPRLDLFRTALLATLIGVAYIVSRGLAKAGSRTTRQPEDPRLTAGHDYR